MFNVKKFILLLLLWISLDMISVDGFIYRLITETLENNVAGEPITHKRTIWDFNPDGAKKRRALFYEKNGYRAEKFIERIGLGLDGIEQQQ